MENERDILMTQNGAKIQQLLNEIQPPVQGSMPIGGMAPNRLYNLGELSGDTTFVLAAPTDNTIANHYYWIFETGSSAPTITWPAEIISWNGGEAPEIEDNMHYEVSVLNGIAAFMEIDLEVSND